MAQPKASSSASEEKKKKQEERAMAKQAKEREKAKRKRAKERAKQEKSAERYRKAAAEARQKAADERARQEALENDPKYQAKQRKEAEKLKARGKKEMAKQRKRSDKKAAKAAKARAKRQDKAASSGGLSGARRGSDKRKTTYRAERNKETAAPNRKRNSVIALVAALALVIVGVVLLWPPSETITMGLDIQGGISVNLTASTTDGSDITQDDMDEAAEVITNRINSSGASNATVQQQGTDSFLVQVPGATDDADAILSTLSSQGVLEFVDLNDIDDETVVEYIEEGLTGMNLINEGIEYEAFMDGDSVQQVTVSREETGADYAVNLQLDSEGTTEFATVSSELVSDNGQIAILLDGEVMIAPSVQSAITDGQVQITGDYTVDEANELKVIIDSGSLPVSLTIEQSSSVGPTLGSNALWSGILAACIGLGLVVLWMFLFYRGLGLLPVVSIIVMGTIYIGLLAGMSRLGWFSLTLPGIAGIIVNIGMAADSSILIMECFHEQIRQGKSVKTASRAGVKEGMFTSLDADIVTLVSAIILYIVAIGDVKGFGLTLALGICCDMAVIFLFSGAIMRLLGPNVIRRHPGFWGTRDDVNEGEFHAEEAR